MLALRPDATDTSSVALQAGIAGIAPVAVLIAVGANSDVALLYGRATRVY